MKNESNKGQSSDSINQNISFFCDNLESYNHNIQNLDTYKTIRSYVNNHIKGIKNLLDIGNGGVFDYDVELVAKITGLDLFLDQLPTSFICPSNVTMKTGSALDIPEPNDCYDGVLMAFLIHHLIGKTVAASVENTRIAINEAHRVLQPGGKMIIVESCIPHWFYQFEKLVFPLAVRVIDKIIGHPATLQYPASMLKKMLEEKFDKVNVIKIPLGRWVVIYGKKVPAFLTPVSPILFVAERAA